MNKPVKPRRIRRSESNPKARLANYRKLQHPFSPQALFSEAELESIHHAALQLLEEAGIRVLHAGARAQFAQGSAIVREDMVHLGRDVVEAALETAPASMRIHSANPERELALHDRAMMFVAGAGCPNVSDSIRGRRPGHLDAYIETLKLQQHFDVLHLLGPCVEPQDVPVHLRHYAMIKAQLMWSDKVVSVFSRGQAQVEQSFELIQLGHDLTSTEFQSGIWATTVINTNSPRLLDVPMAQGIMDFAAAGQLSIISPFCLAGAMAPITVAGALTLQHAEALACITLAQLTRAGAPVSYGGFSSNVDMKSGSPAYGTPAHVKLQIGGGQLARLIGLPWRTGVGTSANSADTQGTTETLTSVWGAMMANANLILHAAGWLEGGLTFGYEKFITDLEGLQLIAELGDTPLVNEDEIGLDALKEVAPGGHFFESAHTMERYRTAFYTPLVGENKNFGTWQESGSLTATQRAIPIWQQVLAEAAMPESGVAIESRIANYIHEATEAGGAPPLE